MSVLQRFDSSRDYQIMVTQVAMPDWWNGRHSAFRTQRLRVYEFESRVRHQYAVVAQLEERAFGRGEASGSTPLDSTNTHARVAKQADALDLGSSSRKGVGVRNPPRAPIQDESPLPRWRKWYTRHPETVVPHWGCGFESHPRHQLCFSSSAVEPGAHNAFVAGSTPA